MTLPIFSRWLSGRFDRFDGLLASLPSRCPLCQVAAMGGHLCAGCEADTFGARQSRDLCHACGADLPADRVCQVCGPDLAFDALVCAIDYHFLGRSLIQMYKEGRQLVLARLLGRLMVRAADSWIRRYQPDAWVPIPASLARLSHTGFSPAQQLARVVAKSTATPCRLDWLAQVREASPQKSLNRIERQQAVKGRFRADPAVAGRCIGLIDDVVTTTSTVSEAATTLRAAGARQVIVLAAARTPRYA